MSYLILIIVINLNFKEQISSRTEAVLAKIKMQQYKSGVMPLYSAETGEEVSLLCSSVTLGNSLPCGAKTNRYLYMFVYTHTHTSHTHTL